MAQIHVNKKLIPCQLPTTFLLRHEGDHAGIHDVDLHVGVRKPILCKRTAASLPVVAHETHFQIKLPFQ